MTEVERITLQLLAVLVMYKTGQSGAELKAANTAGRKAVQDTNLLLSRV